MNQFFSDTTHLENSSEFLCGFTDVNFRFLHTNRLFQKQFNLDEEARKGRPFLETMHTFQMEKFLQANNECLKNPGKTICIEIQTITNMQESWLRWEVSAISNEYGKVEGIQFLGTDITKQKRAEQALLQQAFLLDNISDAIISTDKDFLIQNWNLKAGVMFNLNHGSRPDSILHEIKAIDFIDDSAINFKKSLVSKGSWNGSILIEKNDDTRYYMQTIANATKDSNGKNNGFVAVCRDVTKEHEATSKFILEQKKSQLELVKEQQQFNAFMEHAPTLAWINDESGTLHYMNTLFKNSFELREDNIGKNIYDCYPDAMKENCMASDRQVLEKNKAVEIFEEGIDSNRQKTSFHVYKFPVGHHQQNKLIGGIAVNITPQLKGKIEIEKQRNEFQSFMENAPLLAWITDADGVLHYMNTQFKRAYNYTDDHLNKKIGSVAGLTENEKALLPYKNVLKKNKSAEFFHEFIDKNNKVHYYRTFKFPIKISEGNFFEGGQSIEITGELMAQRDLKKSNELFEYAGKATRDVIWDWNIKDNKIRRTAGYENIFGYKTSGDYETQDYQRIHPDYINEVLKISRDALKGNNIRWQMEYKYLCADGSYKNIIDQAYIIRDKNGKAVRVIGSMADVTEERNLQNQVFKTEIQKKKDVINAVINAQEKERHELSAELHDNVNQLLAASILYLKTARKQAVIEDELIAQSLEYVEKAVNEIRSISHNLTPGDLKMHGLSSALKALTGKLQIPKTFEVKLVCEKIDENKIDPAFQLSVYRIVQESINNILRHANATKVSIYLSEEDSNMLLTVTDNGKGFDAATVEKGLGIINICHRAESLGGTAEVISTPGKGCSWHIKIPLG